MEYELYHYGVKGMKWGVRRYQNPDGTLTDTGKKRISKKYKRAADKVTAELNKNHQRMYVNSYNRAADRMNKGGIDRFNAQQQKKYGDNYTDRDGYMSDYQKFFDEEFTKQSNIVLNNFYKNSSAYQKTQALVEKYNMTSWDELARKNTETVQNLREIVEKYE